MGSGTSKRRRKQTASSDSSESENEEFTPVAEQRAAECEGIENLKTENEETGSAMHGLASKETYGYDETEALAYLAYLIKSDELVVFVERNSGGSYTPSCKRVMDILLPRNPKLIDIGTQDKFPPSAIINELSPFTYSTKIPQVFYKGEFFGFARAIVEWNENGALDEEFKNLEELIKENPENIMVMMMMR